MNYRGEQKIYTPEQIMAMLLSELKQTAQTGLKSKVTDCVISVSVYFLFTFFMIKRNMFCCMKRKIQSNVLEIYWLQVDGAKCKILEINYLQIISD